VTDNPDHVVFLVDDDPSVRRGLQRLMTTAGFRVEGFDSANAFLQRIPSDHPCCLVLDVKMPGTTGPELQEKLKDMDQTMPIIFISAHGDVPTVVRTMKRGAVDFLSKPVDGEELVRAVHNSLEADRRNRMENNLLSVIRRKIETLTPREYEVMTYVIAGLLNKQTAHALSISLDTVKVHRGRIMSKMKTDSVAELVRQCDAAGITRATLE